MYESTDFMSMAGEVTKLAEVIPGSLETSEPDQIYEFQFKLQHSVPVDGFFRIEMSNYKNNMVKLTDPSSFDNNCILIEDNKEIGVECTSGQTLDELEYIDIKCSKLIFGEKGTPKDKNLKFKIKGLTNPRIKNEFSFFKIFSLDQ